VSRLRAGAVAFDDPEAAPRSQLLDIGEADVEAAEPEVGISRAIASSGRACFP
jgi:hypothetical protein